MEIGASGLKLCDWKLMRSRVGKLFSLYAHSENGRRKTTRRRPYQTGMGSSLFLLGNFSFNVNDVMKIVEEEFSSVSREEWAA
jgi:hypothetical protein